VTNYSDEQLLAALDALSIPIPSGLPEDGRLRHNALLLELNTQVHTAVVMRWQQLYDADLPDEVMAPLKDAPGDSLEPTQQAAVANLGILIDQLDALARSGAGGSVFIETGDSGYVDAFSQAALDCALLAESLIVELGPEWPDKDLDRIGVIETLQARLNESLGAVAAAYQREPNRRRRRAEADPARRPMLSFAWTQEPFLLLPDALEAPPAQIRQLLADETERIVAWARANPAVFDGIVTVVKVRGQFLAIIDTGEDWKCSPAFSERSRGVAAGLSAVESLTHEKWNRVTAMWTDAGGEQNLLKLLHPTAVKPGAYQSPTAPEDQPG